MQIELKAKHFQNAVYQNGNGPIRNAADELFPDKNNFEGVEMSRIAGKSFYHEMYGKKEFRQDYFSAIGYDPEKVIRVINLRADN